jgi:hypothetical protein
MSGDKGITINVTSNILEVAKDIKSGTDEVMKMLPNALKQYVIDVIKELLDKSYPAPGNDPLSGGGNTDAGVQQGKDNLRAEINSAFTTWDKTSIGDLVMAKNEAVLWNLNNQISWRNPRMQKAFDKRDINYLYEAFRSKGWQEPDSTTDFVSEPDLQTHQRMRDAQTGAILTSIRNNKNLRVSVRDRQTIENFILSRQKSIGTMAGGWVKALVALGASTPDKFGGNGNGGASIKNGGLTIKAYNQLGDYNGMISKDNIINDTVRTHSDALKQTLQKEIDRILKASGKP